jgi:4-hydroxybenzoate polyprenyltransferase
MESSLVQKKTFIKSLLRLTRVGNLIIIAFSQYFTAGCLIGLHTLNDLNLFLLVTSTVMIAAAGYIINDYYDVKIDYINKPERVVIGKGIPRRYAILFHVVLSSAGILLGLMASWKIGVVNVIAVFMLWLYSNSLKRIAFVGNFTVALLTGLSVLLVDFLYHAINPLIFIYATFAFFMTLIREIIKDMEDLKGDNTFGCKTLPIVLGLRKTKYVIYAILALFVIIVVVLNHFYAALPFRYYVLFLFIPLGLLLFWLIRADMKKDFSMLSSFCKAIMLLGILSMALV